MTDSAGGVGGSAGGGMGAGSVGDSLGMSGDGMNSGISGGDTDTGISSGRASIGSGSGISDGSPTTGDQLANSPTTADTLGNARTAADTLGSSPTTAEQLANSPSVIAEQLPNNPSVIAEQIANNPSGFDTINQTIPNGLTGATQGIVHAGRNITINNPELTIRYESTASGWDGKGGINNDARTHLESKGFEVSRTTNPTPPGSVAKAPELTPQKYTTHNGNLARDAIADRYAGQPNTTVRTEVKYDASLKEIPDSVRGSNHNLPGDRNVDVKVDLTNPTDPRHHQTIEIESKAYRVTPSNLDQSQINHDAARLGQNQSLRGAGFVLERVGKIARPVGVVLDAVDVGSAYRADGNTIGKNTGSAVSGLAGGAAGGWAGATYGAALGSAIMPGVGTVVGGLVGAAIGAWGGDALGKGVFGTISSWFGN